MWMNSLIVIRLWFTDRLPVFGWISRHPVPTKNTYTFTAIISSWSALYLSFANYISSYEYAEEDFFREIILLNRFALKFLIA